MAKFEPLDEEKAVCQSKVAYVSQSDARHALREIRRGRRLKNAGKSRGVIRVYKCFICQHYHHGHDARIYAKKRNQ